MSDENADSTVTGGADTVVSGTGADTVTGGGAQDTTTGADTAPSGADTVTGGNEFSYEAWLAKQDPKIAKNLQKYSSIDDVAKALTEAQKRIGEGFKAPTLPDRATPEQIAEYRKAVGIPDDATGYKLNVPAGVVIGEADKPMWDLFMQNAHGSNLTQAEMDKVAPAYYAMEKQLRTEQDRAIKAAFRENEEALREIWSSDTETNKTINEDFLTTKGGEELSALIANATGSDGKPLANHPLFAKFLNDQARLSGFTKGMVYDAEGQQSGIEDRIKALLDARTGVNRQKYYSQVNAEQRIKDDKLLIELYDARAKFKK